MRIFSSGVASLAALVMVAFLADPVEKARDSYNNCFIDEILQHLDRSDDKKTFANVSASLCETQKAHFHKLIVTDERGYGSSASEAKEYADEEVQGIIDSHVENYGIYLSNNARPQR